ncbi:hypothetical protein P153DRAFT_433116 [Dothidotthia symphoricarpi CBS 119687]|uniref:DUF7918 domain-containing protein n=1 Tax=Dothidotthia symphoricarpi CBS 119687 TaxID=1392245 RepID=A0A6A6A8B9_9PLEO|nr:uncharacterized protein P153DRAFT_433116 [Dothidotthia symphoricarpi CBS 119687]KAF2127324.1 hypothetical protein P153DRAFT_433116 [Dothidotthia symphoricarpi CBS 119687]
MAIVEAFPRLKAEIVVNSSALEEYEDDEEQASSNMVTKYIEVQSGSEFAIKCTLTRPGPGCTLVLQFYLDGKWVCGAYVMQNDLLGNTFETFTEGLRYSEGHRWYLQKFCFSELKIEEFDNRDFSDQLIQDLKDMGEITVRVHRVKNLRRSEQNSSRSRKDLGIYADNVPEKALKGKTLSHKSSLRNPVSCNPTAPWEHDYMDSVDKPIATYKFKYRSKHALQSLLIMPRSPSPVPLEERDVDTLNAEEMRELLRRQRERDEAARAVKREGVKRERSDTATDTDPHVDDDELSFISAKRRRFPVTLNEDGMETIDLT